MKSLITIAFLTLTSLSISAQKIYNSLEMHNEKAQEALYIFFTADEKLVDELVPQHYKSFGDFKENTLSFDSKSTIHSDLEYVDIIINHDKTYSKISYFFYDSNEEAIPGSELEQDATNSFIYDFYDLVISAQEKGLVANDVELAQEAFDKSTKEIKKLKRSIERNLKDQEKLGKKLDATPEELTNLIEEKNNLLQDKLELEVATSDSLTTAKADMEKKMGKAEKAIVKKQKQSDKNAAKLEKREEQLEELTQELLDTQSLNRKLEKVLQRKKTLVLTE